MAKRAVVQTSPDTYFCGFMTEEGVVIRTHNTPYKEFATEFEDLALAKEFCEQYVGIAVGTYAHAVEIEVEQVAVAAAN